MKNSTRRIILGRQRQLTTILNLAGSVAAYYDANTESSFALNNQATAQTFSQGGDLSGNGRHLVQATAGAQPVLTRGIGNQIRYTQEFDNAYWVKNVGSVTVSPNTDFAPDGTMTADKIVLTTTLSSKALLSQSFPIVSGNTYTFSFYAKKAELRYVAISTNSAGFGTQDYANFDLETGSIADIGAAGTASITPISNGWFRCTRTLTAIASGNFIVALKPNIVAASGRDPSFMGDGVSGVLDWGVMVNDGTAANDYIGRNALAFDGVDDRMFTSSFVIPQPFSRFSVVTRRNSSATTGHIFNSRNSSPATSLSHSSSTNILMSAGANLISSQAFNTGQTSQFGELYDGANSSLFNNGIGTLGNAGNNDIDGLNIGSNNTSQFSQNSIHSVILLNRLPTVDERQKLEVYFARRYGILSSLSANNPYKDYDVTFIY